MLRELGLEKVYDSADYNLIADLMIPCISNSSEYVRGVGFFTSGWLQYAAKGISQLAANGGKATFIMSPNLDPEDWEAMKLGELAKDSHELQSILKRNIEELESHLENDTKNALA